MLNPDVRLVQFGAWREARLDRCRGPAKRAADTDYRGRYQANAILPGNDWERLPEASIDAVDVPFCCAVALVRLSPSTIDECRVLPEGQHKYFKTEPNSASAEAIRRLSSDLTAQGAQQAELALFRRTRARFHDTPTVSYNPRLAQFVGLHLDCHSGAPLSLRRNTGNRVSVNLGTEARYLVYCAASIFEIMRNLADRSEFDQSPDQIVEHALSRWPAAPIHRLVVPPGHAYIAPTECIIHDALPPANGLDDVAMLIGNVAMGPYIAAQ